MANFFVLICPGQLPIRVIMKRDVDYAMYEIFWTFQNCFLNVMGKNDNQVFQRLATKEFIVHT